MKKIKPLKIFDGNFGEFVQYVFNEKKPDNTVIIIGNIKDVIKKDLESNGTELRSNVIVISDKKLLRAVRDAKMSRGKSIAIERLHEIVEAIENPLAILKDKRGGQLVYIYANQYNELIVKIVMEPNTNMDGNIINLAKSIGIVEKRVLTDTNTYDVIFGKI